MPTASSQPQTKRRKMPLAPELHTVSSWMRIGDLARVTSKTSRALRLYEEMGLLSPGDRSAAGYRLYDHHAVERVQWIGKLQDLGLSLTDIQSAISEAAAVDAPRDAMSQVRRLLEERLVEIAAQLDRLHRVRREAVAALSYLEVCIECSSEESGSNACVECEDHDDDTPLLIIGLTSSADEVREKDGPKTVSTAKRTASVAKKSAVGPQKNASEKKKIRRKK